MAEVTIILPDRTETPAGLPDDIPIGQMLRDVRLVRVEEPILISLKDCAGVEPPKDLVRVSGTPMHLNLEAIRDLLRK